MSDCEQPFLATAPRGVADLLVRELSALGGAQVLERSNGAQFCGSLAIAYSACLWSRVASRVLMPLKQFEAADEQQFYRGVRDFDWAAEIDPARTIACEFSGQHPSITNTHFGALRLKDAVCDALREQTGARPDVALLRPAVRLVAHARGTRVSLALDLAGESLHRRGYRLEAGAAPLRENLAAGILLRARWDESAAGGAEFLDPMCGSGTLVIEAAMIAGRRAPGLARDYFGFLGWRRHDALLWQSLCQQARAGETAAVTSLIRGADIDPQMLALAAQNAVRAGVDGLVRFEHCGVAHVSPAGTAPGLVCTNPPYGRRLGGGGGGGGGGDDALALHAQLGRTLRERFAGWDAAILTTQESAPALRLRSYRVHALWNGPIACRLLRIDLSAPGDEDLQSRLRRRAEQTQASAGARMFANRITKNERRLARLARRAQVSCYRLYDADMPEYAFAVDRYLPLDGGAVQLHVQEYAPPASIEEQAARRRRHEVLAVLPAALGVAPECVHLRLRERQRGAAQYRPRHDGSSTASLSPSRSSQPDAPPGAPGRFVVAEGGLKFLVNLDDYLDTGLFLDQRLTRAHLAAHARGARFLNLFCYTASASVYAAAGGARESISVDLSNRYLDWAAENFHLNDLDPSQHRLVRADCREWLLAAGAQADATRGAVDAFDLIFLDPPTFSNSSRMQGVLDIQRDHTALIDACLRLLRPDGLLLFSTNAQRFRLDPAIAGQRSLTDLSRATLPFDFDRNPRIHRCYEIRARPC